MSPLALSDIVKAIDCSGDFAALVAQGSRIDDNVPTRAVRSLDQYFQVARLKDLAVQRSRHRTFCVGHRAPVKKKYLERAAKLLFRIVFFWFTSPQFHRALVELLNQTVRIARIDSHRDKIEQGVIAQVRLAARFFRPLPL